MKVRATRQGIYHNIQIEPGQVFELLKDSEGKDPIRYELRQKKDQNGKVIPGKFEKVEFKDPKTQRPVHRDYAEDFGDVVIDGDELLADGTPHPMAGQVMPAGWMEEVPESTKVDVEPPDLVYDWPGVTTRAKFQEKVDKARRAKKIVMGR